MKSLGLMLVGSLALVALSGCIERKITILSNPDGARLQVNGQEMPDTPCTFTFTWYGDYDIILRHEKKEIDADGKPIRRVYYLHTHQKAEAPPHQWLGIDLITEMMPHKFEDHKTWTFVIPEVTAPAAGDLVERALEVKERNDQSTGVKQAPKKEWWQWGGG
jgi:hypothetical protein